MSTRIKRQVMFNGNKKFAVNIERYESAAEVVQNCRVRNMTSESFQNMQTMKLDKFHGVSSYDKALDLMQNGYQPTVEKLRESTKIRVTGNGKRIQFKNDIVGSAPVVPLALKGVPNSMINMTMKPIKCKVIDVYYDMTCKWNTESKDIIKAGQKVLAAILELESQGYRFNLYGVQTYADDNSVDMLVVKLKSSNQPLDLKRISFPLTHTGFFRVIGFDWYSKVPDGKYRPGYGRAINYMSSEKDRANFMKQLFGENALYMNAVRAIENDQEHIKEVFTNAGKN